MIEFLNVTRKYGQKVAVDDLELTIPSGELFALLGPNGAGKTTTIKMLVGLLRPNAGTVRVCRQPVNDEPRRASYRMGYVPDEPHLYDKLTAREFLQFIAEMYGLDAGSCRRRIEEEIERFELGSFADRLTESYSHGMKQRVVFAAAMIHDPAVLVVDEPMVGLDPHSVRLVKDLLRERAAAGMTIFMSTHTLSVAEEIANRIGVFNQGKLVFLGSIDQLRRQLAMHHEQLESLYLELISTERSPTPATGGHHHCAAPTAPTSTVDRETP